jgi:aryl-alcohol dehydrogenase-like predicted oxidoreductase
MPSYKASCEGTSRRKRRFEESGIVAIGHYRNFVGLSLSSLGMGTYLGEPTSEVDNLVCNAIKTSIESGTINVIDTAINYRFQKAERSIGKSIRELLEQGRIKRDELFVCTKNGYLTHDADQNLDFTTYMLKNLLMPGIIKANDVDNLNCMSIPFLQYQLMSSLSNLNLECIDLLYLHNVAESHMQNSTKNEFFNKLGLCFDFYENQRKEGRIQYYGMATWECFRISPDVKGYLCLEEVVNLARCIGGKEHGFRFIQLPINLAMTEAITNKNQPINGEYYSILEAAKRLGIGVFASVPLLQGQLIDKIEMPHIPMINKKSLYCLQFVRSAPGSFIAPIVGHKDPQHVKENLGLAVVPPYTMEEFVSIYFKKEK